MSFLAKQLIRKIGKTAARRFEAATHDPVGTQHRKLMGILKKNSDNTYAIVLGSFDTDQKARGLQGKLTDKGYFSTIQKGVSEKVIYQVQLGKFSSEEKAKAIQDVLDRSGFKNSFLRVAEKS